MKKIALDTETLAVESFATVPKLGFLPGGGAGTACFETCKTDPTSDPDVDTCGTD
ncbi:hypothetical protein [Longimicrobium sp.]|uniref:hypothetical protein n=1 Tax=Longimicrobium sp. TaxID=2029185 RepID=UPI002E301D6B|nr:hypothetical protein [Longimicrobium sp.]HEX6036535.1 hypothetical protein [Longimicrobium sp.]